MFSIIVAGLFNIGLLEFTLKTRKRSDLGPLDIIT